MLQCLSELALEIKGGRLSVGVPSDLTGNVNNSSRLGDRYLGETPRSAVEKSFWLYRLSWHSYSLVTALTGAKTRLRVPTVFVEPRRFNDR